MLSHEHLETRWLPLGELGEIIAGHRLPAGYLGAIRQAIDQPPSPSVRVVSTLRNRSCAAAAPSHSSFQASKAFRGSASVSSRTARQPAGAP